MLPRMHRQIGKLVHSTIHKRFSISLKKLALEYGSIKPDILPKMKTVPHNKTFSFHIVKELIREMFEKPTPLTKKEIRKFSIELGVLLHFTADYFCHVHNIGLGKPFRKHYIYERKLAKKFLKHSLIDRHFNFNEFRLSLPIKTAEHLIAYIDDMHNKYLHMPQNPTLDKRFCLEVCLTAASVIVKSCFLDSIERSGALTG